jgi:tetratricopeptide (TPR) repeat protein
MCVSLRDVAYNKTAQKVDRTVLITHPVVEFEPPEGGALGSARARRGAISLFPGDLSLRKGTISALRIFPLWLTGVALLFFWTTSEILLLAQEDPGAQVEQHFQAAQQAEKAGDLDKAAAEYEAILKLTPNEAVILNNLGLVYHLQGNYRTAIQTFQKAIKYNSDLLGAYVFLGIDYYRTNQIEKAVGPLKTAIRLSPKDVQAHLYLGRCYLELGQYEASLQEIRAASNLEPKNTDILYTLGQVYGKLMSAAYMRMAEVSPDSYQVHQVLAESYSAQKNTDKAIEEYKAAISRSPNTPGLHYALGDIFWRAGRFADAEQYFREELKVSPEDYMAAWKIGNIYIYYTRWDDAIPWIEKAIQIAPDLAQAHRDLGKAYFEKNELEKAVKEYTKVAELAPDEDTVHYRLAIIYRRLGRQNEAQDEMNLFGKLNKKAQAIENPLLPAVKPEEQ